MLLTKNQEILKSFISSKNIQYLYHFTPLENVKSILKYGIFNRDLVDVCIRNGSVIKVTDQERFENARWAICCSISWINNKMLYVKEQNLGLTFAILELDIEILYIYNCVFTPKNAASADMRLLIQQFRQKDSKLDQIKTLFSDNQSLDIFFPDNVQSEVLVDTEKIDVKYIRKIHVRNAAHQRQLIDDSIHPELITISKKLFYNRPLKQELLDLQELLAFDDEDWNTIL